VLITGAASRPPAARAAAGPPQDAAPAGADAATSATPAAAGFTIVDTLALGAFGHVLGVGIVLGLRATGGL
jgi:photosystem I subunit 10